jgi:hypothetical protein
MIDEPMSKSLVLVIGAGASSEVKLPLGYELKNKIADTLKIEGDNFSSNVQDYLINRAIDYLSRQNSNNQDYRSQLLNAAWQIHEAMPLASSIDNFIDARRADPLIAICAKIAIARIILKAESNSSLYVDKSNIYNTLDFKSIASTWFCSFFQLLTENCAQQDLKQRFRSIAIVCFNYDRCIEHFIFSALQTYYRLSQEDVKILLEDLDIFHPYGTVGKLPWQDKNEGISFGDEPNERKLVALANKIRTFTEGTDESSSQINTIRETLLSAKRIAFLGFAFNSQNLELLFSPDEHPQKQNNCQIYATAKGISDDDVQAIVFSLEESLLTHQVPAKINNKIPCSDFFNFYRFSLSLTG